MNLRPLPPQGSALPTAPHPDFYDFIILSHFILKVKAFLKILQHFCVFDDKGALVVGVRSGWRSTIRGVGLEFPVEYIDLLRKSDIMISEAGACFSFMMKENL